jgi:chromate transporter
VSAQRGDLKELAALFLKLGTIAFGGPAAHIAMMEDEVVRRRQWLSREEFLDLLGAANLIPGPNSTEMAIHIGARRAGWPGLLVAGACFILPAMCIVLVCAWAYVRFGKLPQAESILYGVKPVIIAIVLQALWGLGKTAIKSPALAVLAVAAVAGYAAGIPELALLLAAGVVMILAKRTLLAAALPMPFPLFAQLGPLADNDAFSRGLLAMFLSFLKIGSVLYGSGYVLLAFLRTEFVERGGWLTEAQLLDAVAVGQITPGPVFTTATFIGYLGYGFWGGLAATLGIFLPAFFFVALGGPLIPKLRKSPAASAFLDGVNVASLALMAVVTAQLARSALVDGLTLALALAAGFVLIRYKINSAWLVAIGALAGLARLALQ